MKALHYILIGVIVILLGGGGYYWYSSEAREQELLAQMADQKSTSNTEIQSLIDTLASTTATLENTQNENKLLAEALEREQAKNEEFEDQIEELAGTVGVLDKLSKTDKELLQKYSKVYFLNEHYMPERLVEIDTEYLYDESDDEFIHAKVNPFFEDMMKEAEDDSIELWVVSAFRSFDEQADLKGQYTVTYGSGANTFSADQGYSEHQLGTTIDFTTEGLGGGLQGFQNTEAYEWMQDNAYKYGFALSYPLDNQYYVFEPWHWRFVGTDLARDLHRADAYFYDWEQRKIDEYLISIFD